MQRNRNFKAFRLLKFFPPFLFPFAFLFAEVIGLLPGLLGVKKCVRKSRRGGQFFTVEQLGVVAGNFGSEFFAHLFEHFCAYFRLQSADLYEPGIIGKIFSSCGN